MRLGTEPIPRRVERPDLEQSLYEISLRLPDATLAALYRSDLGEALSKASSDQVWWFRRTEFLVRKTLTMRKPEPGDSWARVYHSIAGHGPKFHWKHDYNSLLLVQVLLEIGADPSDRSDPLLIGNVIDAGNPAVLRLLLADDRVSLMLDGALDLAIYAMNREMVRTLLDDERIDPSAYNSDSIIACAETGDATVMEWLLSDPRVDPSTAENRPVYLCCKHGYADILSLLFEDDRVIAEANRDWGSTDETYLESAAAGSHNEVIDVLLEVLEPNSDAVGNALVTACRSARLDTCEVLVQYLWDIEVDIPQRAIAAARTRGRADVLDLLTREPAIESDD